MRHLGLFICMFVLSYLSAAQDQNLIKYSKTISQEDLKKHLEIIASDQYEGRNTGDKGLVMAAQYIETKFAGDKLAGPVSTGSNPFYQEFELEKNTWIKNNLTVGKTVFENGKDMFLIDMMEGINEYDVIFAGYGIYSDKYNDYKDIDVKGKLVAFFFGEPRTKDGKYLVTGTDSASMKSDTSIMGKFQSIQAKAMASMMRGAKGFILIESDEKEGVKGIQTLSRYMGGSQMNFPGKGGLSMSVPVVYVSPSTAAKMFGTNLKKFEKEVKEKVDKGESPGGLYTSKVKIEAERKKETVKTGNVIGVIEGSDKKDEYLAIIAHYDHEGIKNGQVYNGADDNGSGTVALLELAEAFAQAKADGNGPRRSILFIALTGEEKGLLGSSYYTKNPVIPIANTVTALNVDMIGRIDNSYKNNGNYIYIIGDDRLSGQLHQVSDSISKLYMPEIELNYKYNAKDDPEHLYERSDHYNFAQKGVPVIFYTGGEHGDYHSPADDVEKIDFAAYQKRVQLIFATAWQLANANERVKVDK